MSHTDHRYVLISAGGAGTRLWPLSRTNTPKQFQKLVGDETLLQHMVTLASQVVPNDHVFIMTVEQFGPIVKEQLPQLPAENILTEPARRDNGPAMALGMLELKQRDSEATAAILWADHLVKDANEFTAVLNAAFAAAEEFPTQLVTVGANPTAPDTGMGYIHMGLEVKEYENVGVFHVKQFIEKPDLPTATRFVNSWDYLWNVGYKVMNVQAFLTQLEQVQPDLGPILTNLEKAVQEKQPINDIYEQFPKLSIEYLFTQYLKDILVVPSDMGWSDVGNWNILHDILREDDNSLVTKGPVINVNSANSLVMAKDRPIALVGVKDLVVVDAGDTILVMSKAAAQEIKELNAKLAETNPELL